MTRVLRVDADRLRVGDYVCAWRAHPSYPWTWSAMTDPVTRIRLAGPRRVRAICGTGVLYLDGGHQFLVHRPAVGTPRPVLKT